MDTMVYLFALAALVLLLTRPDVDVWRCGGKRYPRRKHSPRSDRTIRRF